jgi:sugar phosphate isomerase/epimerase
MSPSLDPGALREVREKADELGLYLESGLGIVNPYATPEAPQLRAIGDGDITQGFQKMMEACAAIACRELWVCTANRKFTYYGRLSYDRFRTDVSWTEQLAATERFLLRLAPIARDHGIHMNLETHEEITTFELVRLVEAVGPDVTGIVFDTGNVLHRLEYPPFAAGRVSRYVRQTHVKDVFLAHRPGGLDYQQRPCGEGVVDFRQILPLLAAANPTLNLTIENVEPNEDLSHAGHRTCIELFNPAFLEAHPDLTTIELAAYMELIHSNELKVATGQILDWQTYADRPFNFEEAIAAIHKSATHLRSVAAELALPLSS